MALFLKYPLIKASFWILLLFLWAVGINLYYINKLVIFDTGVWVPPFTFRYQFTVLLASLSEQLSLILALALLSFGRPFQLALKNQLGHKEKRFLSVALLLIYVLFMLQQVWLELQSVNRANHGLFFVLVCSLLLGWRWGLGFGLLNWFAFGLLHHVFEILPSYPTDHFVKTLFLEAHLFAPLFLAAFVSLASKHLGVKRFSFFTLLVLALVSESLLSLATLLSTWAPPFYFERFTRNILATPVLVLAFWALVQFQLKRSSNTLVLTQQELALVQAELRALRAQINPHFMLNSLSVIHHLIRTKPDDARELVLDLSDVFQRTLRAGDFVPLSEEIEHVKSYLALEKARLTDRLSVTWSILAEDKLDTLVPTLILQPLVENAVQHGIAPKPKGGTISIVIKQRGHDICIEVADNGVGFESSHLNLKSTQPVALSGASMGLRNIDYRLRLLYGNEYRLELESTETVGTNVSLRIPSHTDAIRPTLQKALSAGEA